MWTHFWDIASGGGRKEPFDHCYIEAPEDEAIAVFYARFGHNVTCTCCGSDYSISEHPTLEQATAYQRGCSWIQREGTNGTGDDGRWIEPGEPVPDGWDCRSSGTFEHRDNPLTVEQYAQQDDVRIIHADEIQPAERAGYVPEQGYVWQD